MSETSLFNLVGEYKELYSMLTDTDEDTREIVEDTLEAVKGELEVKAQGYLALIDQLDMEEKACKQKRDEWDARYKARKNGKERLRKHLLDGMLMLGKNELKAGDETIKVVKTGGVLPLVWDEAKTVPERFTKITIEPDNKLIREALDNGEDLDFVHYGERGVTIKVK